jgi:hypothetical protein
MNAEPGVTSPPPPVPLPIPEPEPSPVPQPDEPDAKGHVALAVEWFAEPRLGLDGGVALSMPRRDGPGVLPTPA